MKPLIIVKLGEAPPAIAADKGDFEDWISAGLPAQLPIKLIDPRKGESLPPPSEIAAAILTGSAAMVTDREPWSETTAAWLRQMVEQSVPVLGICYGHQLLAQALGGVVADHPDGLEVGSVELTLTDAAADDPLFAGLPAHFPVQTTHLQSVRRLPAGAEHLASSVFEKNHAFRFGKCAWGVQFHPEFSAEVSARYVVHQSARLNAQGITTESIRAKVAPSPEAEQILLRFGQLALKN